mgnify:CR=1 FL=1
MIYYLTSGVFCYAKRNTKQKLRQKHALKILLSIAQLPRATFYYHLKRMKQVDKYESEKQEITAIYHENKGRYGYRRITAELCRIKRGRPSSSENFSFFLPKQFSLFCNIAAMFF